MGAGFWKRYANSSYIVADGRFTIFNRVSALSAYAPTIEDKMVIDRIHGWGEHYEESRNNGITFPIIIAIVCMTEFFWGLQPW
jgi:hypothetical protein